MEVNYVAFHRPVFVTISISRALVCPHLVTCDLVGLGFQTVLYDESWVIKSMHGRAIVPAHSQPRASTGGSRVKRKF